MIRFPEVNENDKIPEEENYIIPLKLVPIRTETGRLRQRPKYFLFTIPVPESIAIDMINAILIEKNLPMRAEVFRNDIENLDVINLEQLMWYINNCHERKYITVKINDTKQYTVDVYDDSSITNFINWLKGE